MFGLSAYVSVLEGRGYKVHWPPRDTKQADPTSGYNICKTNLRAMFEADEVHVWYDEKSVGSKFDLGALFFLCELMKCNKIIHIINKEEAQEMDDLADSPKSFFKVLKKMAG